MAEQTKNRGVFFGKHHQTFTCSREQARSLLTFLKLKSTNLLWQRLENRYLYLEKITKTS